jgi:RecB family exonuclease
VQPASLTFVDSPARAFERLADWLPPRGADLDHRATILCSPLQAHAIRRAVAIGRQDTGRLAGVRFITPAGFARELLARRGQVHDGGWEEVRRLRIRRNFESQQLASLLRYFNAEQLRSGRGYAEAFARVIADLEASGIDPDLAAEAAHAIEPTDPIAAHRLLDVATVWADADAEMRERWSAGRLLRAAATAVRQSPALVRPFGQLLAFLLASPSAAWLDLVTALPACTVHYLEARPLRADTQRWRPLLSQALGTSSPAVEDADEHSTGSELEIARRFLFAPAEAAADPNRPRSSGPDGTVSLEEYPSVEDEIDAAALWVEDQIAGGVPLEEIALVVPALDPHAGLLVDRLERTGSSLTPVYVSGGLALANSPAGLRLGALLRALSASLEAEAMLGIFAALVPVSERKHTLSPSRVAEIVYGAGIVGGSAGASAGAFEWLPRLQRRRESLKRLLAELPEAESIEAEKRRHLYTRRDIERWLVDVEPLLPALEALQQLAAIIGDGEPLRKVWQAVRAFATVHLRVIPEPPNWLGLLDEHLAPALEDSISDQVSGFAAVDYLRESLSHIRSARGRFGEPAVFVGTAEAATGLPFYAVRILGLAEGIVPRTPHDDPIVPNDLRRQIEDCLRGSHPHVIVPRLEDRVLEDLHAFGRVVAGTRGRLALSVSRQWTDRSEREVSGVMLEMAAALARPSASSDGSSGDVPTAARLRSAYYAPGRLARDALARSSLQPRPVLTHLPVRNARGWRVPSSWCAPAASRLDRLSSLRGQASSNSLSALDGMVSHAWPFVHPPGLTAARPISASALTNLLACPLRFLLQNLLHFDEPAARPSTDTIDARAYGSLFHAAAEAFFRAHGAALCAREGSLAEWLERATNIAHEKFDAWLAQYPLRGEDSVERERRRLLRQISQLVEFEWQLARREFAAVEYPFGDPQGIRLALPGGDLYVSGQIDRLDQLRPSRLSVRDLKTGRLHDFREEPLNSARDLQLGLYVLALEASSPDTEVIHASYVYPSAAQEPERRFEHGALKDLRQRTQEWLAVARDLLATGSFPRTPIASDCTFCPFQPTCGAGAQARSAAKLGASTLPAELTGFVELKRRQAEADDAGS